MSTVATVPTPNSSSLLRHVPRLTARARALLTAINLHYAGVAALLILDLYLTAHLVFVWQSLNARDANALYGQQVTLRAAEKAAEPLRGLDAKLVESTREADTFYTDRLPYATSQVAAELGSLTHHANVRLAGVQYAYQPVLPGPYALTEMRMDASVGGDYRPVMEFINSIERDHMFFVILGVNLSGQQTGQVNLRLRLITYLRPPNADEASAGLPAASTPAVAAEPASEDSTQ